MYIRSSLDGLGSIDKIVQTALLKRPSAGQSTESGPTPLRIFEDQKKKVPPKDLPVSSGRRKLFF